MKLNAVLLALALSSAAFSANALLVVTPGNVPQIDSNLVRNPCGLPSASGSGNPVQGCLNDNHAQLVNISSDESLEITGGQATLDATDGSLSRLSFQLVANALGTLILDIDATENGFVTFSDGTGPDGTFALSARGSNFFTLTGIMGGVASFVTFNSNMVESDIVADVKQIRLGVVGAIPEPETYVLMLAGLGAIGFLSRRRKLRA